MMKLKISIIVALFTIYIAFEVYKVAKIWSERPDDRVIQAHRNSVGY